MGIHLRELVDLTFNDLFGDNRDVVDLPEIPDGHPPQIFELVGLLGRVASQIKHDPCVRDELLQRQLDEVAEVEESGKHKRVSEQALASGSLDEVGSRFAKPL